MFRKGSIAVMAGVAALTLIVVALAWPTAAPADSVSLATATPPGRLELMAERIAAGEASVPASARLPQGESTAGVAASAEATPTAKPTAEAHSTPNPTAKPTAAATKAPSLSTLAAQSRVKADRYYDDTGYSTNRYNYTQSELKMLAVVIHLEARNQPYQCMLAVGNVVMNRVLAPGFPGDTIKAVVTRPNQFCYNSSVTPNARCLQAATDVLKYQVWVVPQNTYFFRATSSKSDWGKHDYYKHLGNTAFYREVYAGRYNGSAIPQKLFERTYEWPQYGCKPGTRVRRVQIMLESQGYKLTVDGCFGADTQKALVAFQKAHGLTADGIAGPATLRELIRKYGVDRYLAL